MQYGRGTGAGRAAHKRSQSRGLCDDVDLALDDFREIEFKQFEIRNMLTLSNHRQ
jgi:hypothetical protein